MATRHDLARGAVRAAHHQAAILLALLAISAAPALAQTSMPACDDPVTVQRVETLYKFSDDQLGGGFKGLKDIKETGNGQTIENFHKYESETAKIDGVRYCESTAVLAGGKTDKLYYRIPHMVDGDKHTYKPDLCSTRIFTFLGECEDFRPQ